MSLSLTLTFDGHRVRMAGTADQPLWIAKDVCYVLGLHGSSNIARDIPEAEKGIVNLTTPGGPQPCVCVREAGLYRLIARSRKPAAQRFQSWLFGEVLPCIRQHGCYPAPVSRVALSLNVDLRDPKMLAALTLQLTEIVREKDERIAELAPKADVHDRLTASKGDVALMEAGRILGQAPRKFIARLEADGILFRQGGVLEPYSEHLKVEPARFRVRVLPVSVDDDGRDVTKVQTLVTPAGLQWLARRYAPGCTPQALIPQEVH
jgi:anti-repressor protein